MPYRVPFDYLRQMPALLAGTRHLSQIINFLTHELPEDFIDAGMQAIQP